MDFIFENVLPKEKFNKIQRNAKIDFKGNLISYPIEYAMKEIAKFDDELALKFTKDFFAAADKNSDNLAEWFRQKFGTSLAEEYFIPYNKKIWQI